MIFRSLIIFFTLINVLFSDTIYLKNGNKIEGKILQQSKEKVQIQLSNGKTETINKGDINRIIYEKTQKEIEEELKRKQQEEELKRKQQEEELKRKQQEEELKRKQQEEELKRKQQEEELKRKQQEEELKRKQQEEELKRKQQEEELKRKQQENKKINPSYIYLKSALLPGLGYSDLNQKYKTYIWGGLFFASLGYFAYEYQKTSFYKNQYFTGSKNLSNLIYLGMINPFSIEYSLMNQNIQNNKLNFKIHSIQLFGSGVLVLTIYLSQFIFLKLDLNNFTLNDNQLLTINQCKDCQNLFIFTKRF